MPGILQALLGAGTGATPSNVPATIADLQLWLKADAIPGLSDSDPIATWPDESGNARDVTQIGAPTQRPLYKTSGGVGGLPYALFDGVDDVMDVPNFMTAFTAGEVFVVAQMTTYPPVGSNGHAHPINGWSSSGLGKRCFYYDIDGACTDATIVDSFGSTTRRCTVIPPSSLALGHLYEARSGAGEWTSTLNGTQLFTTATNTAGWGTSPNLGFTDTLKRFGGKLHEVIFYSRILNTTERQTVRTYIASKYGLTIA
jgi:hypothetical protein